MENKRAETILTNLWDMYGAFVERGFEAHRETNNELLVEEFFFVILGGFGISYELNKSGLEVLRHKGYLESSLYVSDESIITTESRLRTEFNIKQFEPRTKAGELRKYRFVESKPRTIALAGNWLWKECMWDLKKQLTIIDGLSIREWLCTCPGIGMKSASWFLRNIGANYDYAVFDIHILRFMEKLEIRVPKIITEKSYIQLENILRNICDNIGIALGKMDYLIWLLARNGYLEYMG